ncbi:MAG: tetratricopeptide repeat protein [Bacillota bacterium]|nr:tetratricopeptide repeat protein [Bacillota bacterium]
MKAFNESISVARVLERLDQYLARKDYAAAERHLNYWMAEAELISDKRSMVTIANEQIGFYRKQGMKEQAFSASEKALALAEEVGLGGSITMGTTLINAATACKAFGEAEKALPLYEKAKEIYQMRLSPDDRRMGGLYNNMALALKDLGQLDESMDMFRMAIKVMEKVSGGELEVAITYCNMADLYAQNGSSDNILPCLRKAFELISTDSLNRDGYYAFVCEKCAPIFGFYGLQEQENELSERARIIYEGA